VTETETQTETETVTDTDTETETETETSDIWDDLDSYYSYESFIYGISDNIGAFQTSGEVQKFNITQFVDDRVPKEIKMTLFGEEHTLTYEISAYKPFYDQRIHVYKIHDLDNGFSGIAPPSVTFDAKTGEIIQYSLFPYETMPKTEDECIKILMDVAGDEVDLSEYRYTIKTEIHVYSENGLSKKINDGFYQCKENEELLSYELYFTKYINDIPTTKQIHASFRKDNFGIKLFIPHLDEHIVSISTKNVELLDEKIKTFISDVIDKQYTIEKSTVISKVAFVTNKSAHVLSDVEVEFKYNGESFTTVVQTITAIRSID
jgi:hypothetical protein